MKVVPHLDNKYHDIGGSKRFVEVAAMDLSQEKKIDLIRQHYPYISYRQVLRWLKDYKAEQSSEA